MTDQSFAPPMIESVILTLLGLGYAFLAATRVPPFTDRAARIGLGALALGVLTSVLAANAPIEVGTNPAMSLPVVVGYGVGLLASVVGYAVTVVSLLGPTRWAALILPIGLVWVFAPWLPHIVILALVAYRIGRHHGRQGRDRE